MNDNLANFGIEDDTPRRRGKKRGGRKRFAIEARLPRHVSPGLAFMLGLRDWAVHSRYPTRARRDQALAALVKKERNSIWPWEFRVGEFRAGDDT